MCDFEIMVLSIKHECGNDMEGYLTKDMIVERINELYADSKEKRRQFFNRMNSEGFKMSTKHRRIFNRLWRKVRISWKKLNRRDQNYKISEENYASDYTAWFEYDDALDDLKDEYFNVQPDEQGDDATIHGMDWDIKEDDEEDLLLLYTTPTSYTKDAVCSCK
jgi:hypothetical protein